MGGLEDPRTCDRAQLAGGRLDLHVVAGEGLTPVGHRQALLLQPKGPSDVIHLETGWFEEPHRCDFEFSPSRFPNPEKMLSDLREDGFRVSLWQLPYLNPENELRREAIEGDHVVLTTSGEPPVDDEGLATM